MSAAKALRDAIYDRLAGLPGFATARKQRWPQLQPAQLPALSVFILGGRSTPHGDDNAGELRFDTDQTIAISVARGFDMAGSLEDAIDADLAAIKARLFTDPSFVHFEARLPKVPAEAWAVGDAIYWDAVAKRATKLAPGNALAGFAAAAAASPSNAGAVGALFEAVTGVTTRWAQPREGETYFAEMQIEITFRLPEDYTPAIPDNFDLLRLTTRPLGKDASTPAVTVETRQNP